MGESNVFKKILMTTAAIIAFFFGDDPAVVKFVYALIICQMFDIVTGLFKMIYLKEKFDYHFFFLGIMKKIIMLVAVSFGYFLDMFQILGAALDVCFETAFAAAFITVELISIISNFKMVGLSLPLIDKYVKLDWKKGSGSHGTKDHVFNFGLTGNIFIIHNNWSKVVKKICRYRHNKEIGWSSESHWRYKGKHFKQHQQQ